MEARALKLGIGIKLRSYESTSKPIKHTPGTLTVSPVSVSTPVVIGHADIRNADHVLKSIVTATEGCLSGEFQAMVTGPVNKAIILEAGHEFTGHTEFIAELCNKVFPVMLLANNKMRVALVTTHVPLMKVSEQITHERIVKVVSIAASELTNRFGVSNPHLLACGLNPHAGEQGHFGREEIEIIIPALNELREAGAHITGPVPADTAFTPTSLCDVDLVIAMYHDQGLPVLKSHGFGDTVNITLGLPIIRTSVDHGTALHLAGTGKTSHESLLQAIRQAVNMFKNELNYSEAQSNNPGIS